MGMKGFLRFVYVASPFFILAIYFGLGLKDKIREQTGKLLGEW